MTTIVKHRRTGNEYILLGINGEVDRANPSRFISELFNQEKSAVSCSATVCDVLGNMFLAYIDELVVIEVDGVKPADILPPPNREPNPVAEESSFSRSEYSESSHDDSGDFENDEFDDDEEFEAEFEQKFASQSQSEPPQANPTESLDAPSQEDGEDEDWI